MLTWIGPAIEAAPILLLLAAVLGPIALAAYNDNYRRGRRS